VPTRGDDGRWTGWLDPVPRHDVDADGQVVTANERRGPESDLIGTEFAPPHRARRIAALLEGRTGLTTADFAAVHDDALLGTVPALLALVPGAFDGFDGVMAADSALAGEFAAWRWELAERVAAHPVLDVLRAPLAEHDPVFAPWLDVTARVALALPQLAAAGNPLGIDVPALAREALAAVRRQRASAWGERHVFNPVHVFDGLDELDAPRVPAPPLSGDSDCVRCTGSYPGLDDTCTRGSVARYVWDLADREAGGWVVPMGASGDPASPHHHDQLDAWTTATLVPIVSDWDRLTLEP
jgi:penicillin amidase